MGAHQNFPTVLDHCLRQWASSQYPGPADVELLQVLYNTLSIMGAGGVYDILGGGFCRYSVDDHWVIPHFEKMLYDNAQLLTVYADAAQVTGDSQFSDIVAGTADWVMREMQAPQGGYYSTLDADSEGEEGKFYLWETHELQQLLNHTQWQVLAQRYQLEGTGNFEGKWNLHRARGIPETAAKLGMTPNAVQRHEAEARAVLFAARAQRIAPGRDEKILASWNGLMIKGMARAARLLPQSGYLSSAEAALDFIQHELWHQGRLYATHKDGKTHLNAYLDDYVFVIDAILELLQLRWRDGDLDFAIALTECLLNHFQDPRAGGFFFTSDDHESLLYRPKPDADEATPGGNGLAAYCLLRLGHLLGESRYLDAAEGTLQALVSSLGEDSWGHSSLITALQAWEQPPQTLILRGPEPALRVWQQRCQADYAPWRLVLALPETAQLPPALRHYTMQHGAITAYVCHGQQCLAPITQWQQLESLLQRDPTTP